MMDVMTSGLGDREIVLLSPHLDDAALSAYAAIQEHGHRVHLLTMCGGVPTASELSGWDAECGFTDPQQAAKARLVEDEVALDRLVASRECLPVLDGGYSSAADHAERQSIVSTGIMHCLDRADEASDTHQGTNRRTLVLLPAGAGVHVSTKRTSARAPVSRGRGGVALGWARELKHQWHVRKRRQAQSEGMLAHADHLALRDIALHVLRSDGVRDRVEIGFYEELPYLWSRPADAEVERLAQTYDWHVDLTSLPVDREAKSEAIRAYSSQLAALDAQGRLDSPAGLPEVERYWFVTPR